MLPLPITGFVVEAVKVGVYVVQGSIAKLPVAPVGPVGPTTVDAAPVAPVAPVGPVGP
jgi:hypothetical protein